MHTNLNMKWWMMFTWLLIATLMIYDIYEFRVELKFKNTGYGISRALSVIIIWTILSGWRHARSSLTRGSRPGHRGAAAVGISGISFAVSSGQITLCRPGRRALRRLPFRGGRRRRVSAKWRQFASVRPPRRRRGGVQLSRGRGARLPRRRPGPPIWRRRRHCLRIEIQSKCQISNEAPGLVALKTNTKKNNFDYSVRPFWIESTESTYLIPQIFHQVLKLRLIAGGCVVETADHMSCEQRHNHSDRQTRSARALLA